MLKGTPAGLLREVMYPQKDTVRDIEGERERERERKRAKR
jgi:hypothetical protein